MRRWTDEWGTSLHFDLAGNGERSLILLHELGGTLDTWDGVVAFLAPHFRILRHDQRGAGLSEKTRSAFTVEDHGHDALRLARLVGLPPPFYVAGVASGAASALALAHHEPGQVAALALCCPALHVDPERHAYLAQRSALAARDGMRAVVNMALDRSYPDRYRTDTATYDAYRARFLANDPVCYGRANIALAEASMDAAIAALAAPCLLLAGQDDLLRPPELVRRLAQRIPHAAFAVLESGHVMPAQAPDATAHALLRFFMDHAPTGPASEP